MVFLLNYKYVPVVYKDIQYTETFPLVIITKRWIVLLLNRCNCQLAGANNSFDDNVKRRENQRGGD